MEKSGEPSSPGRLRHENEAEKHLNRRRHLLARGYRVFTDMSSVPNKLGLAIAPPRPRRLDTMETAHVGILL
jgi:hypothetical protein